MLHPRARRRSADRLRHRWRTRRARATRSRARGRKVHVVAVERPPVVEAPVPEFVAVLREQPLVPGAMPGFLEPKLGRNCISCRRQASVEIEGKNVIVPDPRHVSRVARRYQDRAVALHRPDQVSQVPEELVRACRDQRGRALRLVRQTFASADRNFPAPRLDGHPSLARGEPAAPAIERHDGDPDDTRRHSAAWKSPEPASGSLPSATFPDPASLSPMERGSAPQAP